MRSFERLIGDQEKACCRGVSLPQCHVLLDIEEKGQATTGQLAKSLSLDKSTLSRTIDGLVGSGLIKRLSNPSDRRYIPIVLTEQGRATCDTINRASDDYYTRALEKIPMKKTEQVIKNFEFLVQAFLDYESQCETEAGCSDSTHDKMITGNE